MKYTVVNLKENDTEYKYSDLKLASVASIVKNTGNGDKCPIAFFNTTITESYKVLFVYIIVIHCKTSDMNIEAERAKIIEQVKKVNDTDLINAIKSIPYYAQTKDQEIYDIPEAHQNLVMEQFEKTRENPDRLLDWDQAKETKFLL